MTCVSRACSTFETDPHYKSGDVIAPILLPDKLCSLLRVSLVRKIFTRLVAPSGIYEYVIARTKYIDDLYNQALLEGFDQILIFGAGFDTRALRFQRETGKTQVFELDISITQLAKIGQYHERKLTIPDNLTFISIDFDKDSLAAKLDHAGFKKEVKSLFILEGLTMYLKPESVNETFQCLCAYAGKNSWVIFDYVDASVLSNESNAYGAKSILKTVSRAGEGWKFGIEPEQINTFLNGLGLRLIDHQSAKDLEYRFFTDSEGKVIGKVNGTHCLLTAEKI